jgi:hypothetical protein
VTADVRPTPAHNPTPSPPPYTPYTPPAPPPSGCVCVDTPAKCKAPGAVNNGACDERGMGGPCDHVRRAAPCQPKGGDEIFRTAVQSHTTY